MIVTTLDTFTSLLAGFTVFGILGNLAHNMGITDISKVITSGGSSLAFISYPEAISKFTVFLIPQLFSILFFLMLFTLGVGSASGGLNAIIANFRDLFPNVKTWKVSGIICVIAFAAGILFTTPAGQWLLTLGEMNFNQNVISIY
jgi:solute carrier family 6 amino acid transporter-like protein 5/7/9/14